MKNFRRIGPHEPKLEYLKLQNMYVGNVQKSNRKHYSKVIQKAANKTRAAWNIIDSNWNKRKKQIGEINPKINGGIISNHIVIAITLKKCYRDAILLALNGNTPQRSAKDRSNRCKKYIFLRPVRAKEVREIIDKASKKNSAGWGEITGHF